LEEKKLVIFKIKNDLLKGSKLVIYCLNQFGGGTFCKSDRLIFAHTTIITK